MSTLKRLVRFFAVPLTLSLNLHPQTADKVVPASSEALWARLGDFVARQEYARADQIVQQIMLAGDDPAIAYLRIGKIYFDQEAWQRSAGFLEKSLKLNGVNDKVHQLLGLDWRQLHRPETSETEFIEAAKENPFDAVNAYFAGQQLLLNGKCEASLPYLYSALNSKPLHSQVLQALALAQARLGNYGLAESYYRKLLDSDDTSDGRYSALINLGVLLLLGHDTAQLEQGLACGRQAERARPYSPEAHFLTGKALLKLGRLKEASSELGQAAKLSPEDSKPHFLMSQIYDQFGQHDRARKERAEVTRLQKNSRQAGSAAVESLQTATHDFLTNFHR
jgi:Flp pilus assembly protein TadD